MTSSRDRSESELLIRAMFQIAAEYELGFERQVRDLLELGLKRFDLDIGILCRVSGSTYRVIHHVSPKDVDLEDGDNYSLDNTYCSMALKADGPVVFQHDDRSFRSAHPACSRFRLAAYFGIPVRVRNRVYGTLNFSSTKPKPRAFSEIEIDALKLMAAWVGSELSRRQTEAELLTAKALLEKQSDEDPLTHLYNRRGFEKRLVRFVERSAFRQTVLTGIVIDVDDFKATNDLFGHAVGDDVLMAIANVISKTLRPGDVCGRIGGDEFLVLLPDCLESESLDIAERVRTAINALCVSTSTGTVTPSVSVGVFAVPTHVENVRDALQIAGPFLNRAKRAGKNIVAN